MYMLPPFLAVAGKYGEAIKQIDGARGFLWNPDKKLLSHMWDCEKQTFVRKAAGVSATDGRQRESPESSAPCPIPCRPKRKTDRYVKDIIDGCLAHMREDDYFITSSTILIHLSRRTSHK